MVASATSTPKFCRGQSVCFTGGQGIIQGCQPEAGTWAYQIEMEMGLEPDFGRVGYETRVVLAEAELESLQGVVGHCRAL